MTVCGGDSRLVIQVLKLVIPTNDDVPWILRDKSAGTKNKARLLLTVMADSKFYKKQISMQEAAQGAAIFGSDVSSPPTKGSGKAKRKPRATQKKKMEQLPMTQCTSKDSGIAAVANMSDTVHAPSGRHARSNKACVGRRTGEEARNH